MHITVSLSSISTAELLNSYEEGSTLAGVIYVHRISDNRFGGITRRNFNLFRKLCGESTLKNVVIVTNMWKEESRLTDEAREKELSSKFFTPALEKGAQMDRHHNTPQSAHDIIRKIVRNHPVALQIQRELVEERKNIIETAAGESLNQELEEQIKKHRAELSGLREEMTQALREKDEEMRRELEDTKKELEEKVLKIQRDAEKMIASYTVERDEMRAKMKEMERRAKQERERVEVEVDRSSVTSRPPLTRNSSVADRVGWEQGVKKLQGRITIPIYE